MHLCELIERWTAGHARIGSDREAHHSKNHTLCQLFVFDKRHGFVTGQLYTDSNEPTAVFVSVIGKDTIKVCVADPTSFDKLEKEILCVCDHCPPG